MVGNVPTSTVKKGEIFIKTEKKIQGLQEDLFLSLSQW